MSIIPSFSEMKSLAPPFLQPIKNTGKFNSLDQYLDILFRLNREDCFQDFRNAINEYSSGKHKGINANIFSECSISSCLALQEFFGLKFKIYSNERKLWS